MKIVEIIALFLGILLVIFWHKIPKKLPKLNKKSSVGSNPHTHTSNANSNPHKKKGGLLETVKRLFIFLIFGIIIVVVASTFVYFSHKNNTSQVTPVPQEQTHNKYYYKGHWYGEKHKETIFYKTTDSLEIYFNEYEVFLFRGATQNYCVKVKGLSPIHAKRGEDATDKIPGSINHTDMKIISDGNKNGSLDIIYLKMLY